MKKLIYFLIAVNIIIFTSCQNDQVEKPSLKEIFESLPIPVQTSFSDGMNVKTSFE